MMTYTIIELETPKPCHDCGTPTTTAYVADAVEQADGYRDSIELCEGCAEAREQA